MSVRVERRLAAILAADVVGYSRLMAADEEGTLARLRTLRAEFVDPTIAKHHGRIVKLMGDGALVEFASVVDAVRCAVDIQRDMAERDTDMPADQRIRFRIGVNLGDVMIEGDDIYGDGVNVAARLEGLAQPGGIVISGTAFDHAKKAEAGFQYIGRQQVKNIPEPVRIYQVLLDPVAAGTVTDDEVPATNARRRWPTLAAAIVLTVLVVGAVAWLRPWEERGDAVEEAAPADIALDSRRIAVLPFANISASEDDAYFADGMTEELIAQLSKIGQLSVIARTSILKYRDSEKGIDQIGRELEVGTILEGSVRKAGGEVRITAQLIDVASQAHLWSEKYDRAFDGIFAIQSDIAQQVADALQITLLAGERTQIEDRGTADIEAYELYLRGLYFFNQKTGNEVKKGQEYFEKAIDLDPYFAAAYAKLADSYWRVQETDYHYLSPAEVHAKARRAAEKAVALDDGLAEAHAALANVKLHVDFDWLGAERGLRRAIELNPNYARAHKVLGHQLLSGVKREHEEAIAELKKAVELDPWSASEQEGLGWGYYHAERYDEALEQFRKASEMFPNAIYTRVGIVQSLAMLGRIDDAVAEMEETIQISPDNDYLLGFLGWTYALADRVDEAHEIGARLEAKAEAEPVPAMALVWIYTGLGDEAKALDWLERAVEKRDMDVVFMQAPEFRKVLDDEPRYQELRRKLKLGGPES